MVNVCAAPVQVTPPNVEDGVTVIVEIIGAVVVLVVVKEAMLPVPLATKPIAGLLFVQL